MEWHPARRKTTHVEVLPNELCIYEWQSKTVHALNGPAALVWELCDGRMSLAAMAAALQPEFGETDAAAIVQHAIEEFSRAGLLESSSPAGPSQLSRRQLVRRLGAVAAIPVVTSIVAPTAVAAQSGSNPRTFNNVNAPQSFTVPAGVTALQVDLIGASGAAFFPFNPSGAGGRVQAALAVVPGETLTIMVGGLGGFFGFNGGAPAGTNGVYAGGGASDIRRGTTRLIVAGGGGGAGLNGGQGGAGGDLMGANGAGNCGGGGFGGGQASGGIGGGGSAAGNPGTSGQGGAGGNGTVGAGGGGGGGGYFGGGGGGACATALPASSGGGGGGGSSFADASAASNVVHTQGYRFGEGQITLSW